jgi:hypothetical protein
VQTKWQHTCGHAVLAIPELAENEEVLRHAAERPCTQCAVEERVREQKAAVADLPAIDIGTPKQIQWAEAIRRDKILQARGFVAFRKSQGSEDLARLEKALRHLETITDARFWIDNRFASGTELLRL